MTFAVIVPKLILFSTETETRRETKSDKLFKSY